MKIFHSLAISVHSHKSSAMGSVRVNVLVISEDLFKRLQELVNILVIADREP